MSNLTRTKTSQGLSCIESHRLLGPRSSRDAHASSMMKLVTSLESSHKVKILDCMMLPKKVATFRRETICWRIMHPIGTVLVLQPVMSRVLDSMHRWTIDTMLQQRSLSKMQVLALVICLASMLSQGPCRGSWRLMRLVLASTEWRRQVDAAESLRLQIARQMRSSTPVRSSSTRGLV